MKSKRFNIAKITTIGLTIIAIVGILAIGVYFASAYFIKNRKNVGYINFAPGIYLEFNTQTIQIDEENPSNWELKYYEEKDLSSEPVVFNTESEPASPMTEYYVLSPEFKLGKDANNSSAIIYARAKLNYNFVSNNEELSQDQLNYLFDETKQGVRLTFSDAWVESNGWFYYVGDEDVQSITSAENLTQISYSNNANYISVFETNESGIALIRLANNTNENYEDEGISTFKITLTMEFAEVGSSLTDEWFE